MKRREAREKAFQFLFQIDMNDHESVMEAYLAENKNDHFLRDLIEGVTKEKAAIDEWISKHLENWSLERLPAVERTALRLATFEIKYMEDIPENVTINEAVEMGNIFGDEKSGKFINGVLSKMINQGGRMNDSGNY